MDETLEMILRMGRLFSVIKVLCCVAAFQTLLSGCAVDATQVNVAQILAWNQGDTAQWENLKYNNTGLSDSSMQTYGDTSPFFRVTNARMLLGSVRENEGVDADYV